MQIASSTRSYDLEQPRYFGAPIHPSHAPGYVYTLHSHHEQGAPEARTSASGRIYMAEHSGTHIDALCHQAEWCCLHGGRQIDMKLQTPTGFTELGAETLEPIITRGVLLDVARTLNVERVDPTRMITRDDLQATLEQQQTAINKGDVVLVRTGNGALWHDPADYLRGTGMAAPASSWLAGLGVKAVGADNMAWDMMGHTDAELNVSLPGHLILLVRHGIYIIENLFLEALAHDQCYEFTFVCIPLKLTGATGSPVRPIAVI
jgi:kynurenine formamidase